MTVTAPFSYNLSQTFYRWPFFWAMFVPATFLQAPPEPNMEAGVRHIGGLAAERFKKKHT